MAFNLDAAIRVIAKVQGLNEFKALTESLENVEAASNDSRTGLQQLSAESGRLTQEAAKTVGSVKAQASAIQELQTRTRAGAADMRQMGAETKVFGSAVSQVRGQTAGAFDGLASSAAKGASSIRGLQRGLQPTDEALAKLRDEVLAFGAASKQSERSLEQQAAALKNIRSQAEINGRLYNELTGDIQKLTAASKGLGDATLFGVETFKKLGTASQSSAQSIELQIKSLTRLQSTLVKGSEGYRAIGKEIDALKAKAATLDLAKGLAVPGGGAGAVASGVTGAIANIVKLRQELAKTNPGRVILTGEGLATGALAGAAGSAAAGGLGGLAAGAGAVAGNLDAIAAKAQALPSVLKPLGALLSEPAANAAAGIAQWGAQLGSAQAKLSALSAPFEAIGTAVSAIGPEAAAAAGAASLAIASVYQVLSKQADKAQAEAEQAFKGISDDAQRALENLVRLYDRLPSARLAAQQQIRDANLQRLGQVAPDSPEARRAANAVAVAEREIAKIQAEQNQLLEQARLKQSAAADALKRQTDLARQRLQLQQQITAAVKAEQAQYADDRAIRGSIRRNQERLERERSRAERDQAALRDRAAAAFAPSATLALPAAGQTSAPGTGQAISGGARVLRNFEAAGTRDNVGAAMVGLSGQARAALNDQAAATDKARESLSKLFIEIDRAKAASNGSINSLQRQRAAWEALRASVNPAAPAYEKARAKIQQLDAQLQKLTVTQEKAARRGLGREALGGALGALATGGGFQAALGSAAGSLAFAGGVGGVVAGGALTAVGGIGALATTAGLSAEAAEVRLRALTNQFGEYNQAVAATTRISQTLRISNTEAQESFASLYASLRPTGITIAELEKAFIGFSAAARNSGATAQETSNALIQLKQGLASGVLQGEELRSIREQAPLAAQAIAKELGVTIGELKDLAAEGKVTTDVVLRALGRLQETQLDKLNEQFNTGQQALKDLRVAGEEFGRTISRIFGPTVVSLLRGFTSALKEVNEVLGGITGDGEAGRRVQLRVQAQQQAARDTQDRFGIFSFNQGEKNQFFLQRQTEIYQKLLQQDQQRQTQDKASADQQAAQMQAARERLAAGLRAQQQADKKRREALEEEAKIRIDTERRLADFRDQALQRAKDLERSLGDQRLELERSTAEARRRIQQQEQDFALERERQRLRGMGLGTESVDMQAFLNEGTRRLTEQKIQIEQNATDKKIQLERTLEEYKLSVARGISDILVEAGRKLADSMEKGAKGAAAAMTGAVPGGRPGGIIARTGNTGQSTGAHLDARWADGRPITAADADRYLMVNGRSPSSFGVTSSYGPRRLFGRSFHRGIDFGTPSGSGISLKGGASLLRDLGFTGAGGYAVEIMTPEGPMRLLHLQGGSVARPTGSSRRLLATAGTGANLPGMAGIDAAGRRLDAAIGANRAANLEAGLGDQLANRNEAFSRATGELEQQRRSVKEQREDFERMVELQRSGLSPELARQAVDRERMAVAERANLMTLEQQLVKDLEAKDLTAKQREDLQSILQSTRERLAAQPGVLEGLTAEEQAVERLRQAYEQKRQLVEGIANSIGQGIGSAIDLLIDGTDNWGNSLRQIAAGVLKDIARQIAQTMVIQPIVKGITSAFGFADGGIMTADGPLPLRKYAGGGIASSPQLALFGEGSMPEAFVPLPDGRRIPVKMQGGGGATNVVVNVDASGSNVQGDAGRGEQLGRVISQAVQAELIKQRRPGGLLAA